MPLAIESLTGHTTVQASAGSGKTYLLISRVIRLLLSGVQPEHILAITFTRKAANEMQSRLLQRLQYFSTCETSRLEQELHQLQLPADSDTCQQARRLYERLLRSQHSVNMTTFHAFCQDLLRRFPLEAQVPAGFDLLEQTRFLIDEAWEALMVEAAAIDNGVLANALQQLFTEYGLYNTKLALNNFIAHRSDWWAYTFGQTVPWQAASERLQQQLSVHSDQNPCDELFAQAQFLQSVSEFNALLIKHATDTNLRYSQQISLALDQQLSIAQRYHSLRQGFLTQAGTPLVKGRQANATLEKKLGSTGLEQFLKLHDTISQTLIATDQQLAALATWQLNQAWYLAGQHLLAHFQRLKQEQRVLDFVDLEWRAYLLLNHSNNALWIQYKLDARIEHLLVDEFQDTNPTQWRLLLPLLQELAASQNERQRSVFLVGDAKQSIYRFRRAEPRLFSAASSWLKEQLDASTIALSHSWRSSPAIINFVNQLFSQASYQTRISDFTTHATHKPDLWGAVTLLPLIQTDETEDGQETLIHMRNPLLEPRPSKSNQNYVLEGQLIAEQIQQLITAKTAIMEGDQCRCLDYHDIIILVRSRTHVHAYEQALQQHNIPYVGAERGTLLESLEVRDMLHLLQWLILPFDNLALAGILKSPLFSLSDAHLVELAQYSNGTWFERLAKAAQQPGPDLAVQRAYTLLKTWQSAAILLPVHDLLDKIYSEGNVLRRYQAAFPATSRNRVSANLKRFLEFALELDSGRYPSLSRFAEWLNELRQLDHEAPDAPVTEAGARVRIMSIHAAKGLEAPVVFLADATAQSSEKHAYSVLVDWPASHEQPAYFFLTGSKQLRDPFATQCIAEQGLLEQQEEANLLYVAVTRAKQYLFVSGSSSKRTSLGWYGDIAAAYAQELSELVQPVQLETSGQPLLPMPAPHVTLPEPTIDPRLSQPVKVITQEIEIAPSRTSQEFYRNPDNDDEDARQRGIIIHEMLNYLSSTENPRLEDFTLRLAALPVTTDELANWWQECQHLLRDDTLQQYFALSSEARAYNEVPISYQDGNKVIAGVIDRLLVTNNSAIVIDYKSHQASTAAYAEIANHYQSQMQLYAQGVKKLWPDKKIIPVIIFTHTAEQVILPELA